MNGNMVDFEGTALQLPGVTFKATLTRIARGTHTSSNPTLRCALSGASATASSQLASVRMREPRRSFGGFSKKFRSRLGDVAREKAVDVRALAIRYHG